MATIVKTTSGTWKAVIRKTGWPTAAKTFRTKRDAEDWSRRTEDEMVRGAYIQRAAADRMTLADALKRYAGLGIVYGEDPANRFASFRRFVLANRDLFSQIPSLNFTYVSTSSGRASLASALLRSLFGGPDSVHNEDMKRYFRLRQMYENNALGSFTDADYAFWTRNHKQYSALNYEPLFAEFCGQTSLSDSSLVVQKRMFSFCHFIPSTTLREGFEAERRHASSVRGSVRSYGEYA